MRVVDVLWHAAVVAVPCLEATHGVVAFPEVQLARLRRNPWNMRPATRVERREPVPREKRSTYRSMSTVVPARPSIWEPKLVSH